MTDYDRLYVEPDDTFDIVVLDRVLHMLPNDDTRRRMLEAVRPEGQLMVADTPKNLPMIRSFMDDQGEAWEPTLARKGFLFWQRDPSAPTSQLDPRCE